MRKQKLAFSIECGEYIFDIERKEHELIDSFGKNTLKLIPQAQYISFFQALTALHDKIYLPYLHKINEDLTKEKAFFATSIQTKLEKLNSVIRVVNVWKNKINDILKTLSNKTGKQKSTQQWQNLFTKKEHEFDWIFYSLLYMKIRLLHCLLRINLEKQNGSEEIGKLLNHFSEIYSLIKEFSNKIISDTPKDNKDRLFNLYQMMCNASSMNIHIRIQTNQPDIEKDKEEFITYYQELLNHHEPNEEGINKIFIFLEEVFFPILGNHLELVGRIYHINSNVGIHFPTLFKQFASMNPEANSNFAASSSHFSPGQTSYSVTSAKDIPWNQIITNENYINLFRDLSILDNTYKSCIRQTSQFLGVTHSDEEILKELNSINNVIEDLGLCYTKLYNLHNQDHEKPITETKNKFRFRLSFLLYLKMSLLERLIENSPQEKNSYLESLTQTYKEIEESLHAEQNHGEFDFLMYENICQVLAMFIDIKRRFYPKIKTQQNKNDLLKYYNTLLSYMHTKPDYLSRILDLLKSFPTILKKDEDFFVKLYQLTQPFAESHPELLAAIPCRNSASSSSNAHKNQEEQPSSSSNNQSPLSTPALEFYLQSARNYCDQATTAFKKHRIETLFLYSHAVFTNLEEVKTQPVFYLQHKEEIDNMEQFLFFCAINIINQEQISLGECIYNAASFTLYHLRQENFDLVILFSEPVVTYLVEKIAPEAQDPSLFKIIFELQCNLGLAFLYKNNPKEADIYYKKLLAARSNIAFNDREEAQIQACLKTFESKLNSQQNTPINDNQGISFFPTKVARSRELTNQTRLSPT